MAIYLSDHFLVAGDPAQSPEVLRDVYQNAPPDVRRRLAENPSSPEELLFRLSKDSDPEVRASLAYNKVVPLEILEALAGDEDVNVRLALAEEFELPPYILQKLCEDQNPYVRDRAEATLEGLLFESQLKSEGFIQQAGTSARLGDLLVAASVLTIELLEEALKAATEHDMPLGRVLVIQYKVDPLTVIRALKLQSLVRRGKISLESAEQKLTTEANQRKN
jgi:hypothetical protein